MKLLPNIDLKSLHLPAGMDKIVQLLAQGSPKVSAVGAGAGAVIDVVTATRDERGHLSELAKEYRPEIAERLGLAEEQVTEAHFNQAFSDNPVLAQVKEVSQMSKGVRLVNSAIAVGVGVLAGLGVSAATRRAQSGGKQADAANIAGGVAATLGAAGVGKVVRKLMHTRNLEGALENTAHHKIMLIKNKQQRGEETTPADIFLVQLALNSEIDGAIKQATGTYFAEMEESRQLAFLQEEFPDVFAANTEMARLINEEGLRPQQLVFGEVKAPEKPVSRMEPMAPGHPDLPPNAEIEPALEASGAEQAARVWQEQQEKAAQQHAGTQQEAKEAVAEPPVTPRSETPLELELQPKDPAQGKADTPPDAGQKHTASADLEQEMGKRFERALQAMQEGRGKSESFAGRVEAERHRQQEASPQR